MKRYEKLALVFLVIWLLTLLPSSLMHLVVGWLYGAEDYAAFCLQVRMLASANALLSAILNIAVAIALFIIAKREKRAAWVWFLLGFAFGLLAALFLYLVRIDENLKELRAAQNSS